jgi:hypothetical protein
MPKSKKCTKLIPRIYKRSAENLGLFFFVKAQQQIVPTIKVQQAIWNYFKFTDIDDWDMECARVQFSQLEKEYYDYLKNETT